MKLAIVDLGTNSLRVDIYQMSKNEEIKLIHREKRMVRLGDGVFESGEFSKNIIKRGREAFLDVKTTLTERNVDRVIAFATSAMRCAHNADEFIDSVESDTGIRIKVISGIQEGELIAKGILADRKSVV